MVQYKSGVVDLAVPLMTNRLACPSYLCNARSRGELCACASACVCICVRVHLRVRGAVKGLRRPLMKHACTQPWQKRAAHQAVCVCVFVWIQMAQRVAVSGCRVAFKQKRVSVRERVCESECGCVSVGRPK